MSNYIFLAVGRVGSSTDLIVQKFEFVQDMDKRNYLMDLLHTQCDNGAHGKCALTLAFVETKRGADALERWLSMNGFPATAIHGDKVQMVMKLKEQLSGAEKEIQRLLERCDGVSSNSPASLFSMEAMDPPHFLGEFGMEGFGNIFYVP